MQPQGVQYYAASVPPTTAVGEFQVQTAPYDASVGHTAGALLNMTIKSGTNQLHGEAHEWFRNRALDAPNIFQNRTNTKLPVYQDNRFGFAAGGPVVIPKLYDGRNKTFFFNAFEKNIFGVPQTFVTTVPRADVRNGDLSYLLKLGPAYQIYDPFSTTTGANGQITRSPIPGNIIAPSRINPVAKNILDLYPLPNQPGNPDGTSNWVNADTSRQRSWTDFARVDHAFSEKNRLFVRLNKDYWQSQANRTYSNSADGVLVKRQNRGLVLDDVHVFSPSFLVNLRYGLTRQLYGEQRLSQGFDLTSLGFSAAVKGLLRNPDEGTVPRLSLSPFGSIGAINEGDGIHNILTHSMVANAVKQHGSHALKWGIDFRVYLVNHDRHSDDNSPFLSYNASLATGPTITSPRSDSGRPDRHIPARDSTRVDDAQRELCGIGKIHRSLLS